MNTYEKPCVFIKINYKAGLDGSNILILKEVDVKIITDLMMGGDGTNVDGELGELHLSAISEAMNQMMGSSATSLSSMLGRKIDISPPQASRVDINDFKQDEFADFLSDEFVAISFRMQIGDLIDSTILQHYPLDFARELYRIFMSNQSGEEASQTKDTENSSNNVKEQPMNDYNAQQFNNQGNMNQESFQVPPMGYQATPMGYQAPPAGYQMPNYPGNINVSPAQFQAFNQPTVTANTPENINLIMDVPLEVTVELGRTKKSIADILDFAPGTIIELDKIAGEPIDVLVNGKFVAKGEVVVIEESFGIRITEIIN